MQAVKIDRRTPGVRTTRDLKEIECRHSLDEAHIHGSWLSVLSGAEAYVADTVDADLFAS